jgi:peroxiredoxin
MTTDLGLTYPLLADPDLRAIRAFGIEHVGKGIALPSTFVLASDGRIVYRHVGKSPADRPDLEAIVAAVRKAKASESR